MRTAASEHLNHAQIMSRISATFSALIREQIEVVRRFLDSGQVDLESNEMGPIVDLAVRLACQVQQQDGQRGEQDQSEDESQPPRPPCSGRLRQRDPRHLLVPTETEEPNVVRTQHARKLVKFDFPLPEADDDNLDCAEAADSCRRADASWRIHAARIGNDFQLGLLL